MLIHTENSWILFRTSSLLNGAVLRLTFSTSPSISIIGLYISYFRSEIRFSSSLIYCA